MEKILFINACVRKDSRTYELAKHVLKYLKGELTELTLKAENIPPLDEKGLEKRTECSKRNDFEDEIFGYAKQFADSDTIVISAPYWDLSFPAMLKNYMEAICIAGITFSYSGGIPHGLCKAGRLIYITTAGGQIGDMNYGFDYVKALSQNLFGIPEIRLVKAENLDIIGNDPNEIIRLAKEAADKEFTS